MPPLSIKNLSLEFLGRYETDCAVEGVSFDLEAGEMLGLVGASDPGKSTNARMAEGLQSPDSGALHFDAIEPGHQSRSRHAAERAAANGASRPLLGAERTREGRPQHRAELIRLHRLAPRIRPVSVGRWSAATDTGSPVGCASAARLRDLAWRPRLRLLGGPTSALSIPAQAQLLDLPGNLPDEPGLTMLFIGCDLSAI